MSVESFSKAELTLDQNFHHGLYRLIGVQDNAGTADPSTYAEMTPDATLRLVTGMDGPSDDVRIFTVDALFGGGDTEQQATHLVAMYTPQRPVNSAYAWLTTKREPGGPAWGTSKILPFPGDEGYIPNEWAVTIPEPDVLKAHIDRVHATIARLSGEEAKPLVTTEPRPRSALTRLFGWLGLKVLTPEQ